MMDLQDYTGECTECDGSSGCLDYEPMEYLDEHRITERIRCPCGHSWKLTWRLVCID